MGIVGAGWSWREDEWCGCGWERRRKRRRRRKEAAREGRGGEGADKTGFREKGREDGGREPSPVAEARGERERASHGEKS